MKQKRQSKKQPEGSTPESSFKPDVYQEVLEEYIREQGGASAVGGPAFVKKLMGRTFQALLNAEMEEHLGYAKGDRSAKATDNARNGSTPKTVRSDFGPLEISTPRDREGSFEPKAVAKRERSVEGFAEKIVSLYTRGLTTREIGEHLKEIYGVEASPAFISRATEKVLEEVVAWQNRTLDRVYPVLYMDGLRISVRQDHRILKKVIYIALGVTITGHQEVLGLWIAENEGAAFWVNVLSELKARGVEDILIACVDGLKGLPEAIETAFPQADVQLCVVHQIRNSTKFISYKDRRPFCKDLKNVYGAPTADAARQALDELADTWESKYPSSVKSWKANWERLTTFFRYPPELRRIIYTTNSIESLNSQLRKNTSNRKVFPSDEAAFKLLYLNIRNLTKKWSHRKGWDMVMNQLTMLFPDRLPMETFS